MASLPVRPDFPQQLTPVRLSWCAFYSVKCRHWDSMLFIWKQGSPSFFFFVLRFFKKLISWHAILYHLASDVQHSDWTFMHLMPGPTWQHTWLLPHCWLHSPCWTLHPVAVFITNGLYILLPSPFLFSFPTPLPSGSHQVIFCMSEFVSVLFVQLFYFFKDVTYKWNHMVLVLLCLTYFT